ncbi:MAG: hypothetical protein NZM13_06785 [Cyclobacteriaceae bacterium]|nr:hypothetical protein [Cyclobacteriaceae bacterium]MDW8331598.1 hypothetical protein [Cyclobacteriaceae bacterium]
MRRLLLIAFLFRSGMLCASDCKRISKEEAFNNADIIFLGHVFEVSDSTYRIKVIEWFKGVPKDTLVGVITQSVIVPEIGSIWLILGQSLTPDRFLADVCSGSKSLDLPHGTYDITVPEVPPRDVFKNPSELFLLKQMVSDKALNEFYFDVASLRARKSQEENKLLKSELEKMERNITRLADEVSTLKWLIVILALISIGAIFLNFRKR